MSAPVKTARTPGIDFAAAVSIRLMLAWAYGLRRMARWAIPGSLMSSRKRPRPVMNRRSSRRLIGAPRTSVVIGCLLSGRGADRRRGAGPHHGGRLADRRDDVLVAGTATDVALDGVPDLVVRGVGVMADELRRGHDHARRAEP